MKNKNGLYLVIGPHCQQCAGRNGRHPEGYPMIRAGLRRVWVCPQCESIRPMSQEEIDAIKIEEMPVLVGR